MKPLVNYPRRVARGKVYVYIFKGFSRLVVSVRFRRKEQGTRVSRAVKTESPLPQYFFHFSLLRNQTETLATQAMQSHVRLLYRFLYLTINPGQTAMWDSGF